MTSQYPRSEERNNMVESQIAARGISDPAVLTAMRDIPRHIFIPPPWDRNAYADTPLPIGDGQTISQPYIVALMTSLLRPKPTDVVLEIGAGSGYQAAILSRIVQKVISIERIESIAEHARANLASIQDRNVTIVVGDGTLGYPALSPYNGILITAAAPAIPEPLKSQLGDGGRLVAPIGGQSIQELLVIERHGDQFRMEQHGGVRFVPLIGKHS